MSRVDIGTAVMAMAIGTAMACGGDAAVETARSDEAVHTSGDERPTQRADGVQVEGLMGTINADDVRMTIEPRLSRFLRCFEHRYDAIEILGGRIYLSFRVDIEGSVLWVYPKESSIGDRDTERCILETASALRFPRPRGGEAEFGYPMDLDTPEEVRPPVHWEATYVEDVVQANRATVSSECGRGYSVTVYVAPGGAVLASGVATQDQVSATQLDCVATAVRGWEMPDPGSYPAKVTFSL